MRKFDKVSARLSFSQKYCSAVAENAIKPLVFMYREAMSIFLGSKNVLILVYFWVFQKYTVSDPPGHILMEGPLGVRRRSLKHFPVSLVLSINDSIFKTI